MIRDFKPRLYQETIFSSCTGKNTLVVLPTGMGKTALALMLAAHRIENYPSSKILFLAPTKPLAQQHLDTFTKHIYSDKLVLFTGAVSPEKRGELWKKAQFVFSTPQGLENDVISGRVNLKEVSLLVFDEAHRATGDYAYTFIAKQYDKLSDFPRILALTASPGSDKEKINEICSNLFIEEVEVRVDSDPDVKPYIQKIDIDWVTVNLPASFLEIHKFLKNCYDSKLKKVKEYGYLPNYMNGKTDLLKLQARLHSEIAKGNKDFEILKSISLIAEAGKVQHAIELVETQGISALKSYMEKMKEEASKTKSKAVQNLVQDLNFRSAYIKTCSLFEKKVDHPKLHELRDLIVKEKGNKIIIFAQYRDTATRIEQELVEKGVKCNVFVGQTKKGETGLTQKKQKEMLDEFRSGLFNVLIATSVAEEGLDIPKVDLVVFYEAIPSAIRTIQRRGRTGRSDKGRVVVLMAKGTRDEGYRWSAHHKEKRMHRTLAELKNGISLEKPQQDLNKFIEQDLKIFVDDREKSSGIIKELIDMGLKIDLKRLDVGDYILSSKVGVEYKTVPDFVDSIIDGRLLEQIKSLKHNYERPLIILEGEEDIYSQRKIHPNAIRGMLATISVNYGIPVLRTKNFKDTASLLAVIAKREQNPDKKYFDPHTERKPLTLKEQQEYIISALPNVGPVLAKELLKYFGSVRDVMNASADRLTNVEKVGEKKAKGVRDVVDKGY
ncbi:DEAD/DEAH box helicase [Nanoarchaeota archaeon]